MFSDTRVPISSDCEQMTASQRSQNLSILAVTAVKDPSILTHLTDLTGRISRVFDTFWSEHDVQPNYRQPGCTILLKAVDR